MKNFELISFANPDELARAAAAAWLEEVNSTDDRSKPYCVALSGGRVTQKFFAQTVTLARLQTCSLDRVQFFWADERCVPPTDEESNFKMAKELLFGPMNLSANQIHRLRGEIAPAEAVKIARVELETIAPTKENGQPALDLVFLGMGEDGHVASLFPSASRQIVDATAPFLVIENSPKPPPTRVSMSYATIAAAKKVWVLASGAGKAAALRDSLDPAGNTPLARVIQSHPGVRIYSDITPI